MTTATKRVLPADVYDTLELSALAYGGIGAGWYTTNIKAAACGDGPDDVPLCVYGHGYAATAGRRYEENPIAAALSAALIYSWHNDEAVIKLAGRRRRISFAEWCTELGVERGA